MAEWLRRIPAIIYNFIFCIKDVNNVLVSSNLTVVVEHAWCSGNITAFQAVAPGSIPGVCKKYFKYFR